MVISPGRALQHLDFRSSATSTCSYYEMGHLVRHSVKPTNTHRFEKESF